MRKRHADEERQIERKLEPAQREHDALVASCQRVIESADAYLASTADPKIRVFARELQEQRTNLAPATQEGPSIDGRIVVTHSSYESYTAAINRINQILCVDLKALAFKPLTDAEFEEVLLSLRGSIPAIVMKKFGKYHELTEKQHG